jgi:asparaginyl-tRNA synthetase
MEQIKPSLSFDIKELYENQSKWIGLSVKISGSIKFFRTSGKKEKSIGFAAISDGSCAQSLQVLFNVKSSVNDTYFNEILEKGKTGMTISVTGEIVKSPKTQQPIEMHVKTYVIHGDVEDAGTYPISKSEHSMEHLRTVPHLRIRTDTFANITRIKSTVKFAMAKYFDELGFYEVQIPLLTDNECESGANPFVATILNNKSDIDYSKDFFKKQVFLTVSGQLHLECMVLEDYQILVQQPHLGEPH